MIMESTHDHPVHIYEPLGVCWGIPKCSKMIFDDFRKITRNSLFLNASQNKSWVSNAMSGAREFQINRTNLDVKGLAWNKNISGSQSKICMSILLQAENCKL
jgi:hypothetical protein